MLSVKVLLLRNVCYLVEKNLPTPMLVGKNALKNNTCLIKLSLCNEYLSLINKISCRDITTEYRNILSSLIRTFHSSM